jgi:hypothetical protein
MAQQRGVLMVSLWRVCGVLIFQCTSSTGKISNGRFALEFGEELKLLVSFVGGNAYAGGKSSDHVDVKKVLSVSSDGVFYRRSTQP